MKFKYTPEHLDFIQTSYQTMNVRDLAKAFNDRFGLNKPETAIHSVLKNHKITCGRKGNNRLINRCRLFSLDQENFIRREYPNYSQADLVKRLNDRFGTSFSVNQLKAYLKNHGITSGRTGRFTSGHQPWNSGTKGLMKPNSGNFKKGSIPPNRKPLGSERICPKDGYILMKVAEKDPNTGFPTRYKHKHVHIWEQTNGPVPEGYVVVFKDGDQTNCELDNLILVSRAELLALNRYGYKKAPAELKPSVMALTKLQVMTWAKEKVEG